MNCSKRSGISRRFRIALRACAALVFMAAAGCGNGRSEPPPEAVSRTALETALRTWRDGGKPGPIAGTDPPVQVFDTPWSRGDRLASFEILGEEATVAERRFTVKLSLVQPRKTEEVQFYVLGQGPVMVFRDQDYLRNINMENGPRPIRTRR